jgi:hypothetical protein
VSPVERPATDVVRIGIRKRKLFFYRSQSGCWTGKVKSSGSLERVETTWRGCEEDGG